MDPDPLVRGPDPGFLIWIRRTKMSRIPNIGIDACYLVIVILSLWHPLFCLLVGTFISSDKYGTGTCTVLPVPHLGLLAPPLGLAGCSTVSFSI